MEFPVPQFIEMETKIVGPLTWRQFIFIGGVGVIIFFLYFIIKFFYFIIIALILGVLAISFAFLKVGGRPLPNILLNFLTYTISSKIYIWKKETVLTTFVYKKEKIKPKKEKAEEGLPLRVAEKSCLQDLSTQVELRTK